MNLEFPLRSAFVALPLEKESQEFLAGSQNTLDPYGEMFLFQNPRTSHLTLQFWKEIMEIEYQQITRQCDRLAIRTHPFQLSVTGIDTFGSRDEDRVLFLSIAFSQELAVLKKACPWESLQPFHPHITTARISHPQKFRRFKKQILRSLRHVQLTLNIERIALYAQAEGKKQTLIQDFSFSLGINPDFV